MSYEPRSRTVRFDGDAAAAGLGLEETDGMTLRGLAVPFNSPTRIDSQREGLFDEEFAPGAFKRSLGMRTPVVQFQHGQHPLIGSLPIASGLKAEEVSEGLRIEARMLEAALFEPVREGIRAGAITGMSIRFRPHKIEIDDSGDIQLQRITEAELFELGPVVFPAYADTEVELRTKIEPTDLAAALLRWSDLPLEDKRFEGPGTASETGAPAVQPNSGKHSAETSRTRRERMLLLNRSKEIIQ